MNLGATINTSPKPGGFIEPIPPAGNTCPAAGSTAADRSLVLARQLTPGGLGRMGTGWVTPPRTADCWVHINHPHRLCRLKNYELLKFCNINDCSHLLIWQPAMSPFLTLLTPVIKTEYFWFGRQLEECDCFVSWGSWGRTCIPLPAVAGEDRDAVGEDRDAGGDKHCAQPRGVVRG